MEFRFWVLSSYHNKNISSQWNVSVPERLIFWQSFFFWGVLKKFDFFTWTKKVWPLFAGAINLKIRISTDWIHFIVTSLSLEILRVHYYFGNFHSMRLSFSSIDSFEWIKLDKQIDVSLWWCSMTISNVSSHEWQNITCWGAHQTCEVFSACQCDN